ncbi:UGSC family (seleno)protein [Hydrogenophaga sp.]|uniref:UGSC family (seleno)protein n=1 Tax=Hydrogenophaga sp. TaxID=1904254 RepID=UPI003F6E9FA6
MSTLPQPIEEFPSLEGACELEAYPGEVMERRIARGDFDPLGKRFQVLNPRGTPPAITLRPMAPRAPEGLDGRTVYLVDVRFMNGKAFLEEIQKVMAERFPGVRTLVRQKRGGYTEDDPELWAEIEANRGLVVMAIGHCSTCAPAVAVHCMNLEERGIPTAPLVTGAFTDLVRAVARKGGMPKLRFTFVPHPVSGKSATELQGYVEGASPGSDLPVMDGIVQALTATLSSAEAERGQLDRPVQPLLGADTEDELHRMFLEAWWSDGLPVVLPTPERVEAMLKGTKHSPSEVVGRMRPTATQEDWSYTVEQVATNAVMAGAKPEHFPVILALAASQVSALHSSTSNFAAMVAVNGPIRHEIRMNSGVGALGPFNHANAAIGRAWSLLSRNLGGGAIPGITYLGTQGNPLNYNTICFAENQERSPWEPFHVQQGFRKEESTISLFRGRTYSHMLEIRQKTWQQQLLNMVGGFTPVPGTGLTLLLEPLAARALYDREGFKTKEQIADWYHQNSTLPYETYWDYQLVVNYVEPLARKGQEPFASYLAQEPGSQVPRFADSKKISTLVVGGEKNAYWFATDFIHVTTLSIDEWR